MFKNPPRLLRSESTHIVQLFLVGKTTGQPTNPSSHLKKSSNQSKNRKNKRKKRKIKFLDPSRHLEKFQISFRSRTSKRKEEELFNRLTLPDKFVTGRTKLELSNSKKSSKGQTGG